MAETYTQEERDEAIEWLRGLADLEIRGLRLDRPDENSYSRGRLAYAAVYSNEIDALPSPFHLATWYLEAAALIEDGWVP